MDSENNPVNALQELIAERQRFESWLHTLELRRENTPPAVFERVQGDYQGRLDGVLKQLTERADELKGTLATLETRLQETMADEQELMDQRVEAELRTEVGEYTHEEWERLRADTDEQLA